MTSKSLKWRYSKNLDDNINSHRNHFKNVCDLLNILPLNHCIYYNEYFDGNCTYYKGIKKSQIDFVLTNDIGRSNVKSFKIVKSGWHISDHLSLDIQLCVTYVIDSYALLIRTNSLKEEYSVIHNRKSIIRFKDKFGINEAKKILSERADALIET